MHACKSSLEKPAGRPPAERGGHLRGPRASPTLVGRRRLWHIQQDGQMGRQTDRQTDRWTQYSSIPSPEYLIPISPTLSHASHGLAIHPHHHQPTNPPQRSACKVLCVWWVVSVCPLMGRGRGLDRHGGLDRPPASREREPATLASARSIASGGGRSARVDGRWLVWFTHPPLPLLARDGFRVGSRLEVGCLVLMRMPHEGGRMLVSMSQSMYQCTRPWAELG